MSSRSRLRSAVENRKERIRQKVPMSVVFELRRKAIHIVGAIVAVPALLLLPLMWAVGLGVAAMLVISVTYILSDRGERPETPGHAELHDAVNHLLETTRREGEGFPWASVLFLASLVAIALWTHVQELPLSFAFAAYGILGMGDAASALIGVAYGRTPIPWNPRKSVQGSVAGAVVGFLSGVLLALVFFAWEGQPFPPTMFLVIGGGATSGMLIESLPGVQDNLTVPLGAMGAMVLLAAALGFP